MIVLLYTYIDIDMGHEFVTIVYVVVVVGVVVVQL